MALSFDLLTGLTISGILAILAIYVIVVYKKGWLSRESKADQAYYLCPNQKCKKVFNKPVWLTDLSRTPPDSFQACPHCGISIQTSTSSTMHARVSLDATPKPTTVPSEVRGRNHRSRFARNENRAGKRESVQEPVKPNLQTSSSRGREKPEERQISRSIFKFPQVRKDAPQQQPEPARNAVKSSSDSPKKCSHFFGYVRTLPKNTPIPDECLWCPSIVDCLTHEEKVEAQA